MIKVHLMARSLVGDREHFQVIGAILQA
ncbi:uncharacterized protein METZ01_LOCUS344202 [marine metagenome]|uniref:Uncharacterized protein n=1 Tax=marine metagenome TaxID=408172 RepID=A0A382R2P8_9ZZZZ